MRKKSLIIVISTLFLISNISFIISDISEADPLGQKTIYVDDDNINGPWRGTKKFPFNNIQDGVDNSKKGDIVFVFNGLYNESVVIDKSILIIGENKTCTIIDGAYNDFVINIKQNYVQIKNFTIRNSGGFLNNAGIKLDSDDNQISNCNIYRTKTGIYVDEKKYNEINDCIFYQNGEGVYLKFSKENNIKNSYFFHNGIGVNIESSENIKLTDCYANTNGIAYFLKNSSNIESIRCAAYNNNDNQGGFFIIQCENIMIFNSHINHNGFGIRINNCSDIKILSCNLFWNTHNAISIWRNSNNIYIEQCEISENLRYGIYVEDSIFTLKNNNIYKNLWGFYSERALCNASYNWWGSTFGPAFFQREIKDRIMMKSGRIKIIPWNMKKVENAGASWNIDYDRFNIKYNNTRYGEINLSGPDTDKDLVPDWWEEKWDYDPFSWDDHKKLDCDNDGLNNIEECFTDKWDSNPYKKDIFLEIDWIEAIDPINSPNKPSKDYLEEMIEVFEKQNISIHIDTGNLEGGEEIPSMINFSFIDLKDIYWDYFLHNDLNNPRKGIFHYCLVCDYGPSAGFAFIGWDSLDSFQIAAQKLQDNQPKIDRETLIIGGSIHELGHTLGLNVDDHGGNDNLIATKMFTIQWWKYLNYRSCMNYWHTYKIIDFSDGSHGPGDFDDWLNMDFSFFKNTYFIKPDS